MCKFFIRPGRHVVALAALILSGLPSVMAQGARPVPTEVEVPPFTLPDDVSVRPATVWSDGTRLGAYLYAPKGASGKLPTIIMAYDWGGTMDRFRTEAAAF